MKMGGLFDKETFIYENMSLPEREEIGFLLPRCRVGNVGWRGGGKGREWIGMNGKRKWKHRSMTEPRPSLALEAGCGISYPWTPLTAPSQATLWTPTETVNGWMRMGFLLNGKLRGACAKLQPLGRGLATIRR